MLEKKIETSMREALKNGDRIALSVLRMMTSEIKNYKISVNAKEDISDEAVIKILQKMAKKYRESIASFREGNREDLVKKETSEMEVLGSFLPEPLSGDQIDSIIDDAVRECGASSSKDFPLVMKIVISRTKGRADGSDINARVRLKLGG